MTSWNETRCGPAADQSQVKPDLRAVDGSYQFRVQVTPFGDISLALPRDGIEVILDPVEAARMCQEVWEALRIRGRTATQPAASEIFGR